MTTVELGFLGFTFLMLVGCIGVLFSLHLSWKKVYQHEAQRSEELEECRREIEMLASSNLGIGKRVERLGRDLNWLREQIELAAQAKTEQISYDQVARLAGQGTDVKGLVSVFGISEAEAELVVKLNPENQTRSAPKTPAKRALAHH